MYKVIITSHAERELKRLDRSTKNRIIPVAQALADNPRPHGCLKVKAEERLWRIRVGDWRIGYEINDETRTVKIIASVIDVSSMPEQVRNFNVNFSQPDEERLFSERNAELLSLLPDLNDAMDSVLRHTVKADRQGLTVFMLGRRCSNDFAEILRLASNGYGFAALSVLRSMFEKLVDATYLHKHPEEVDAFWDYHFVQLEKLGYADIAKKFDPNWEAIAGQFKRKGKKGLHTQPRWAKNSLVKIAKGVGLGDHLKHAYYLPNLFIHNSVAEIIFGLQEDQNGRFTPVDSNNPKERRMADIAVVQAIFLLLSMLELAIEHYDWDDSTSLVQNCVDSFGKYFQLSATGS